MSAVEMLLVLHGGVPAVESRARDHSRLREVPHERHLAGWAMDVGHDRSGHGGKGVGRIRRSRELLHLGLHRGVAGYRTHSSGRWWWSVNGGGTDVSRLKVSLLRGGRL